MFGNIIMRNIHGNDPSCVITGSSTHNERVERFWKDLYRSVSSAYVSTFIGLESEGVLDALNDIDLFCLHYVFLPRINKSLKEFQEGWNYHRLSSEGNMSPYQLFFEGRMAMGETSASGIPIPDVDTSRFGVESPNCIEVPSNKFVPCAPLLNVLLQSVDPLSNCQDFGKQLYHLTIRLMGQHLEHGCTDCQI